MVNGPEDVALSWEAVDWRHHEDNVRRLRQRIFTAAQEGNLATVRNSTTHLSRPRGLLELLAVKAARAVLRGDRRSNPPVLPDRSGERREGWEAAPTTAGRVGTTRRCGSVQRDQKVQRK
jgi:hypothetical protein